ncbi:MAG: hypothetical protein ACREOU_02655, partial [Candidatus Eiseniibacteriota bacterium]
MNEPREDYLWDRSGTPDPEIERLEHALQSVRADLPPSLPGLGHAPADAEGAENEDRARDAERESRAVGAFRAGHAGRV